MESKTIRIFDDTYLMLAEIAEEHGWKINKAVEIIVLAEYLRTHDEIGKPQHEPEAANASD